MNKGRKIKIDELLNNPTPEFAYVLGLLWADGYINKKRAECSMIKTDLEQVEHIFYTLGEWCKYIRSSAKRQVILTLISHDKRFINFLIKNDYKAKSSVSADKILEFLPMSLHNYWFRGYFDGDGHIGINHKKSSYRISFSSSLKQDWNFLIKKLKQINIIKFRIRLRESKKGNSSELIFYTKQKIIDFGNFIYRGEKFRLSRKFDKFQSFKEYCITNPRRIIDHKTIFSLYKQGYRQRDICKQLKYLRSCVSESIKKQLIVDRKEHVHNAKKILTAS